jgi:hypothetical protein
VIGVQSPLRATRHRVGSATAAPSSRVSVSPLVSYALRGLWRCWMPDRERYSYRFKFDAMEAANESIPVRDAFYTLNVLLGLSQCPVAVGCEYLDFKRTYDGCCAELSSATAPAYALGMALWTGARLNIEPPGLLVDHVGSVLESRRALHRLTAQDVGMLLSGATAMAQTDGRRWRATALMLAKHLEKRYHDPGSRIFYNQSIGCRRRFSSFASQVYSILALYHFGEAFEQQWAITLANDGAARMLALQGVCGEWGWFYYVPNGQVVDFYEIYSVHQHGMAPAFLHHTVAHGVPGAREALVKGFLWVFGGNEMAVSMLRPNEGMFYRSQAREGELDGTAARARRSIINVVTGRSDAPENHRRLVVRQECRSYELGWILWSFGGRSDYPELTERPEFAV